MGLGTAQGDHELPEATKLAGGSLTDAVDASESIPPFIMESMLGVYMKGMGFVFAVQEQDGAKSKSSTPSIRRSRPNRSSIPRSGWRAKRFKLRIPRAG